MKAMGRRLAIALLLPLQAGAQSASAGDDGTTTIGIFRREFGVVQLNTADESANLKFGRYLFDETQHLHWINLAIGAKAEEGVAALFAEGNVAPGFTSDLQLGYNVATSRPPLDTAVIKGCQSREDAQDCIADYMELMNAPSSLSYGVWVTLGAGLRGESLKLYDATQAYEAQISSERSFLPRTHIGVNFWTADFLRSSLVGGLTFGVQRENNRDDLTKEEIETYSTVTSPSGTEQRRALSKTTAYRGSFTEFTSYPLNGDLIVAPHRFSNLALNVLSRLEWRRDAETDWDLGAGVLFLKKEDPRAPLGGLFVLAENVLSDDFSETSFWEQVKVSLVLNIDIPRIR